MKDIFAHHCSTGHINLKSHDLDRVIEDLHRFGTLSVVDAFAFQHFNVHIKPSYFVTARRRKTGKVKAVEIFALYCDGEGTGLTSTEAVMSATKWKTQDAYSLFLVEDNNLAQDGEQFTQCDIQAEINRVYIGDTKKAGHFSHLLELFKEDVINNFSSLVFDITQAELPRLSVTS